VKFVIALAVLVGALALWGAGSGGRARVAEGELLLFASAGAAATARAIAGGRQQGERRSRRATRATEPQAVSDQLLEVQRVVEGALAHAGPLHRRLRPLVREIAAERLQRRGLDLERDQDEVQDVLSTELRELTRVDRPAPADGLAPGADPAELDALVGELERL
jgi:hypothetical protein